MPAETLAFRQRCGLFMPIYIFFMFMRCKSKLRKPGLKMKTMTDGVVFGTVLSYLFWGSLLLLRCGDVELNPGPPSPPRSSGSVRSSLRQQTLNARQPLSSLRVSESDSPAKASQQNKDPTLADIMTRLNTLDTLDRKFDQMKDDFRGLKDSCLALHEELKDLKEECASLRGENANLKEKNVQLEKKMEVMERKVDDLECRSKRNNIIIHGLHRREGETPQDLENAVNDMFTDKLELARIIPFDRLHRLNNKANSPVIGCCSAYKDKLEVLRAKGKLRGSNLFVGEDFSQRVRDIRRRLIPHLKKARSENKRATMVFDHIVIDGQKFFVDDSDNLIDIK